ncbi:VAN3-binding protein [Tanacetum coccineum]|uniref:VAN3-binding protein n=1 Tax=Tanacetum coccineum TaxID=301880 RepID=A0ABQ4ZN86_9ASTR
MLIQRGYSNSEKYGAEDYHTYSNNDKDEDEDDDDDVEEEYDSDMDTTINEEDVSRNDSDVAGSDVAGDDDGDDDNEVDENDDDGMDTKIEDTNHADMEELDKEYNDLCHEEQEDDNDFLVELCKLSGKLLRGYIRILSWSQRIKVALDAANTVAYLHNPEAKLVYHGSMKIAVNMQHIKEETTRRYMLGDCILDDLHETTSCEDSYQPKVMNISKLQKVRPKGKWFHHNDIIMTSVRKIDKVRAEKAQTHAVLCVAGLATTLDSITTAEIEYLGDSSMIK